VNEHLHVLELDGMEQSAVDLLDPTNLVFDYMRRIGDLIDAMIPSPPTPIRALHIGGAGMAIPRYVAATRPRSAQIVLEPDEVVIAQVRIEAPLPRHSGIKVRPVDGSTGIQQVRSDSQDLVVLDAFERAVVPEELTTTDFMGHVRRVLVPGGVFVANLVDRPPFALVRRVVGLGRDLGTPVVGVEPSTLKGRRSGNVVVVCGGVPRLPFGSPPPMEYRVFAGRAVNDRFG
jgi:spermidine synthase